MNCGAPQLRVTIEPPAPSTVEPPSREDLLEIPPLAFPAVHSTRVQWSQALPGAALGGAFSLLAVIVPFAIFGPAFLAGGALSVVLYRRRQKNAALTPAAGAQIGAASGGFGYIFVAIPFVATLVYRPDELRRGMLDSISQLAGRGYDPQRVQQVQEFIKTPQGLTFFVVFGLFMLLLIFVIGSSIGGALYAAWVQKRASSSF